MRRDKPVPRVAAVHDLSGLGRCSLTAVIPILSRRSIQVCPLPTALLSTQTDGYDNYYFKDLTVEMEGIIDHWRRENVRFDAIYTGFLGSPCQARVVSRFIDDFRREGDLIAVDPVMGDKGEFYGPYGKDMIAPMADLISRANLITPNLTEAAFLLGRKYPKEMGREELRRWCVTLSDMGPERVVITSAPSLGRDKGRIGLAAWDRRNKDFFVSSVKPVPQGYPGTGDAFASLLLASLLRGRSFRRAVREGEKKIKLAIKKTNGYNLPRREGILLEKYL